MAKKSEVVTDAEQLEAVAEIIAELITQQATAAAAKAQTLAHKQAAGEAKAQTRMALVQQAKDARVVGMRYRRELGWDARPAWRVVRRVDGSLGCECEGLYGRPCDSPGKHPMGAWAHNTPTERSMARDFRDGFNVAILTGQRSGVMVGDVDPRHGGKIETLWAMGWPQGTPIARSGGGGWHVYVECPAGGIRSIDHYALGIELKANGKLVIAPPSRHLSLRCYRWLPHHSPFQIAVAPLPAAVLATLATLETPAPRAPRQDEAAPNAVTPALAYSPEETLRLATVLVNYAIKKVRQGEHRNNTAYWLGQQLNSLGLADAEVMALAKLYERSVRYDG